jgi:hypothetical protein
LLQAVLPAHWPTALHVWGVLPLQRRVFGEHTPQIPAPTQSEGHAASSWKRPSAPHVCGVVVFAHCLVPGTHEPAQDPVVQTKGHGVPVVPKCPLPSQVCGWSPLHRDVPGAQSPQTPAPKQTPVHAAALCHCPFAPQVWGVLPLHWLAPGLQRPEQLPAKHTKGQSVPFVQLPLASQVCGVTCGVALPAHCFALGTHVPPH